MRKITTPSTAKIIIKTELYARHSDAVCRINDRITQVAVDIDYVDNNDGPYIVNCFRENVYDAYTVYGQCLAELSTENVILDMIMVKYNICQDAVEPIKSEIDDIIKYHASELKNKLSELYSAITDMRTVLDEIDGEWMPMDEEGE